MTEYLPRQSQTLESFDGLGDNFPQSHPDPRLAPRGRARLVRHCREPVLRLRYAAPRPPKALGGRVPSLTCPATRHLDGGPDPNRRVAASQCSTCRTRAERIASVACIHRESLTPQNQYNTSAESVVQPNLTPSNLQDPGTLGMASDGPAGQGNEQRSRAADSRLAKKTDAGRLGAAAGNPDFDITARGQAPGPFSGLLPDASSWCAFRVACSHGPPGFRLDAPLPRS